MSGENGILDTKQKISDEKPVNCEDLRDSFQFLKKQIIALNLGKEKRRFGGNVSANGGSIDFDERKNFQWLSENQDAQLIVEKLLLEVCLFLFIAIEERDM